MAETKAPAAPVQDARRLGEILVEIADERNSNVMWPITKVLLRGRWARVNTLGQTMAQVMQPLPDIPGLHVGVDCARKLSKILDPLNEPRNAELVKKIQAVLKEAFRQVYGPEKDVVQEGLSDGEIKSWLYWMRRLVDNGQAVVIKGELPDLKAIRALPGKIAIENYNSSSRAVKFLEDAERLEEIRQSRFEQSLEES
jgi:hypothetical protein